MKTFDEIQILIDKTFQEFIAHLFRLDSDRLKYYYWTSDFFETVGNLSFQFYELSQNQKDSINLIGKTYFGDSKVYFEVNKNSHRNDILIKNIRGLFSDTSNQEKRYEYLKEFIQWQILLEISQKSKEISSKVVEQQKKNFLITYLKYLLEYTQRPSYEAFKDYTKYTLTNQGEELEKKLQDLDDNGVDNKKLREKLDRLYIHKNEESKIHFVFSRFGGEEKEELRELLDVMGREETGKLYRGQANATWKLDSSLTRESKYLNHEAEMYYDILSLKPDAFSNDHTVYDRLITMQHFGMPTRLMDITRNPLVAIFFACNNLQRANSDGVVYTFAPKNSDFLNFEDSKLGSLKKLFEKPNHNEERESDEFLNGIWFIKGIAKNQRINNQSGDFIFVGNGGDISKGLAGLPALTIVIDAPTKTVLLEQLESLNIHGGSVYPDLTHMSNYIRTKYLEEKLSPKYFEIEIDTLKPEVKKKINPETVKTPTNRSVKKGITQLTPKYNLETFWNKRKYDLIQRFSKEHDLNAEGLEEVIEKYFFTEKDPLRDEVVAIMRVKPKLQERQEIVKELIRKIIELADLLRN